MKKTVLAVALFFCVAGMDLMYAPAADLKAQTPAGGSSEKPQAPVGGAVDPTFAKMSADWKAPFTPHHVVGNVYYVGSSGLAAYLITTPAGHILINSNLE